MAVIVLAHGAWSSGWAWKKVRPHMAAAGHQFFTPSYTGLGERAHLADPSNDLETHIEDVLGVITYEDLRDVVLVGHSYGGMVATGVADRARGRVAQLIYLDAFVPGNGEALVDLTPGTSAQGACNYAGQNVPGNPDPSKTYTDPNGMVHNVYDGQQVCNGGSARDFNNNAIFDPVRIHRQRLLFGLNYRYEMLLAGAQVITDLLSPSDANSGQNKADLTGEKRQSTVVLELGALF